MSLRQADSTLLVDHQNDAYLSDCLNNAKKCIVFLFNEYKIVLEAVLFENSVPFMVVQFLLINFFN